MSTEIDVETDPATAFTRFTEEYDQWWGNGPIDCLRVMAAGCKPRPACPTSETIQPAPSCQGRLDTCPPRVALYRAVHYQSHFPIDLCSGVQEVERQRS